MIRSILPHQSNVFCDTIKRPSDLEVYLLGPDDGPSVELFKLSGNNDVPDFNGTSSLGLWTLEV